MTVKQLLPSPFTVLILRIAFGTGLFFQSVYLGARMLTSHAVAMFKYEGLFQDKPRLL